MVSAGTQYIAVRALWYTPHATKHHSRALRAGWSSITRAVVLHGRLTADASTADRSAHAAQMLAMADIQLPHRIDSCCGWIAGALALLSGCTDGLCAVSELTWSSGCSPSQRRPLFQNEARCSQASVQDLFERIE